MKLTHPNAPGVTVEPKAEHAAAYQSQGWIEQSDEKPAEKPDPKK